jgi:3-dehydroquinate synthase
MTETVLLTTTPLPQRTTITIGSGLLANIGEIVSLQGCSTTAVVADRAAEPYASRIVAALGLPQSALTLLAAGEQCKDVTTLTVLWERFAAQRLDRRAAVIAVGGGACSDVVGFAAGTYMRGVRCIVVPTTLLAQVDASIGGKSGINFCGVKNLLGVVSQPSDVVIDVDTLATLPEREVRSGFAEIVKHGIIADASYFGLVTSRHYTQWAPSELTSIITRSCEIKRVIVESDELEAGPRKSLNFGHTVGHAIEAAALADGVPLTHGDAVSIGMVAESWMAHATGSFGSEPFESVCAGLRRAGLPTHLPHRVAPQRLRELISRDKKNVAGQVRWTLPRATIGEVQYDTAIPEELIMHALEQVQPPQSLP